MGREAGDRCEQIIHGARECFARYGYEGATVRRLERTVNLSRGAIFHYFEDKDAVFLAVAREDTREFVASVQRRGVREALMHLLRGSEPQRLHRWAQLQLEITRRLRIDERFSQEWGEGNIVEQEDLALRVLFDGVLQQLADGADPAECAALVEAFTV